MQYACTDIAQMSCTARYGIAA